MSTPGKESFPPSYSESIQQQYTPLVVTPTSRGQSILDQLTLVRAQHIRSVISNHILPLVEEQAAYGIAQTIIALLPSDIPLPALVEKSEFSFDSPSPTPSTCVEVIGFSSDETPKVVRLEGQMNKTEFWKSQDVIVELERTLRESLNASPKLGGSPVRPTFTNVEPSQPYRQQKKSLFGRFAGAMAQDERIASSTLGVEARQADSGGQVLVKVRLEEICLRNVNEFGLYDTMSKQCVIIRVDARC